MPQGRGASGGKGGGNGGQPTPEQMEQMRQAAANYFIEEQVHINCPVTGAEPDPETPGFIRVKLQVGPKKFESFYIGRAGQDMIAEASKEAQKAAGPEIEIARGKLPPHPEEQRG